MVFSLGRLEICLAANPPCRARLQTKKQCRYETSIVSVERNIYGICKDYASRALLASSSSARLVSITFSYSSSVIFSMVNPVKPYMIETIGQI